MGFEPTTFAINSRAVSYHLEDHRDWPVAKGSSNPILFLDTETIIIDGNLHRDIILKAIGHFRNKKKSKLKVHIFTNNLQGFS